MTGLCILYDLIIQELSAKEFAVRDVSLEVFANKEKTDPESHRVQRSCAGSDSG